MQVYSNVLDMVGKTPMLEIRRLDTGLCQLFLKLELRNPVGSVKDRIGIAMIEARNSEPTTAETVRYVSFVDCLL